jgi:hypothetical protein
MPSRRSSEPPKEIAKGEPPEGVEIWFNREQVMKRSDRN